jgi:hypothetical protein
MFDLAANGMAAWNQVEMLVAALACLGLGGALLGNRLYWRMHGMHVQGEIIGVRETEKGMYRSVYRYSLPDGQRCESTSDVGSNSTRGRDSGRIVDLLVFRDSPQQAKEAHNYLVEIVGAIILIAGAALFYGGVTRWPVTGMTLIMGVLMLVYLGSGARRFLKPPRPGEPRASWKLLLKSRQDAIENTPVRRIEEILGSPEQDIEQQKQRKGLRFVVPLLLLGGFGLIALSLHLANQQSRMNASGARAPGHVISLQSERSDNDTVYYPIVSFDVAGTPLQFKDHRGSNPASHEVGEAVTVLFLPSSPQGTAMIDRGRWNWLPVALTGLFGTLLVILAVPGMRGMRRNTGVTSVDSAGLPDQLAD